MYNVLDIGSQLSQIFDKWSWSYLYFQEWVVETFYEQSALVSLWNSVQNPQYVQPFLDQGYNTSQIFFEYLNKYVYITGKEW